MINPLIMLLSVLTFAFASGSLAVHMELTVIPSIIVGLIMGYIGVIVGLKINNLNKEDKTNAKSRDW